MRAIVSSCIPNVLFFAPAVINAICTSSRLPFRGFCAHLHQFMLFFPSLSLSRSPRFCVSTCRLILSLAEMYQQRGRIWWICRLFIHPFLLLFGGIKIFLLRLKSKQSPKILMMRKMHAHNLGEKIQERNKDRRFVGLNENINQNSIFSVANGAAGMAAAAAVQHHQQQQQQQEAKVQQQQRAGFADGSHLSPSVVPSAALSSPSSSAAAGGGEGSGGKSGGEGRKEMKQKAGEESSSHGKGE